MEGDDAVRVGVERDVARGFELDQRDAATGFLVHDVDAKVRRLGGGRRGGREEKRQQEAEAGKGGHDDANDPLQGASHSVSLFAKKIIVLARPPCLLRPCSLFSMSTTATATATATATSLSNGLRRLYQGHAKSRSARGRLVCGELREALLVDFLGGQPDLSFYVRDAAKTVERSELHLENIKARLATTENAKARAGLGHVIERGATQLKEMRLALDHMAGEIAEQNSCLEFRWWQQALRTAGESGGGMAAVPSRLHRPLLEGLLEASTESEGRAVDGSALELQVCKWLEANFAHGPLSLFPNVLMRVPLEEGEKGEFDALLCRDGVIETVIEIKSSYESLLSGLTNIPWSAWQPGRKFHLGQEPGSTDRRTFLVPVRGPGKRNKADRGKCKGQQGTGHAAAAGSDGGGGGAAAAAGDGDDDDDVMVVADDLRAVGVAFTKRSTDTTLVEALASSLIHSRSKDSLAWLGDGELLAWGDGTGSNSRTSRRSRGGGSGNGSDASAAPAGATAGVASDAREGGSEDGDEEEEEEEIEEEGKGPVDRLAQDDFGRPVLRGIDVEAELPIYQHRRDLWLRADPVGDELSSAVTFANIGGGLVGDAGRDGGSGGGGHGHSDDAGNELEQALEAGGFGRRPLVIRAEHIASSLSKGKFAKAALRAFLTTRRLRAMMEEAA